MSTDAPGPDRIRTPNSPERRIDDAADGRAVTPAPDRTSPPATTPVAAPRTPPPRRSAAEVLSGSTTATTESAPKPDTPASTGTTAPAKAAPRVHKESSGTDLAQLPMALAAMGSLAAMSAGFGTGTATADTGQPHAPPTLASGIPTGTVAWDSGAGAGYTARAGAQSERGSAMGELNAELSRLLGDTVDSGQQGRATMAALLAEVDTALTALGPVSNTSTGQRQVMTTLESALGRAGRTVDRSRMAAALTADKIQALAQRYVQESAPAQPTYLYSSSGPPGSMPSGHAGQWINDALQILLQQGYSPSQLDPAAIATIIAHESAGNPHAINLWDSNAAAGHPSKGIMQCIDSTFRAYALPGHTDIWNPVDNIIAGVRYSISRYGSLSNVPGVHNLHQGGSYVGY